MAELINIRCNQGHLIITEEFILTERFDGASQSMARASFTGLETKGALWNHKLIFHGLSGQRLKATGVSGRNAKAVKALLTGR